MTAKEKGAKKKSDQIHLNYGKLCSQQQLSLNWLRIFAFELRLLKKLSLWQIREGQQKKKQRWTDLFIFFF